MTKNISIIGGDLRIIKLAEMLSKDDFEIKTYAIEKAESLDKIQKIKKCKTLDEAIQGTEIVIGPIPLSSNNIEINTPFSENKVTLEEIFQKIKNKKFIAGNIKKEFYEYNKNSESEIIDLLECEELVVLNTIATAEGAIQIAMEETIKTIHSSNVLVLGFGRVGKILASKLKALNAKVYCASKNNVDLAWIKAYGYKALNLIKLNEKLNHFDIIINTIPALVLEKEKLKYLKKDCLLVDLASNPGGIDRQEAQKQGIKTIWALALPGKVAPFTSAEYIKDTIYNLMKENKK